jgi:hypothetical protein
VSRRGAASIVGAGALSATALVGWLGACSTFSSDVPDAPDGAFGADAPAVDGYAVPVDAACSPATSSTDPRNCGACGHDCRGALCARGICQPEVVLSAPGAITTLTLTASELYFTTEGADAGLDGAPSNAVVEWPTTGTLDGGVVVASGQSQPMNVRIDGNALYWVDRAPDKNRVLTCARDACAPTTFLQGPALTIVTDVAIDDGHRVYVLMDDEPDYATIIRACPPSGCLDAGGPPFATTTTCGVTNLVFDKASVYWSSGSVANDCPGGAIHGCPITGCTLPPVSIVRVNNSVRLAGSAAGLFYAAPDAIVGLRFPDLTPLPIASLDQAAGVDIAADDTTVYWLETSGLVRRAPAAGGPVLTLADGQTKAHAIGLDAEYVYWVATSASGAGDVVVRVAK